MAVYSAVLRPVAAVSSLTFVLVTGVVGLLGLGPEIFLIASGLAAVPAGRLMDRTLFATGRAAFGLGVGWNLPFVAATAQLVDLTSASERGKLIGFNDLLLALLGASLALLGGYALDSIGVAALAIGATAIVAAPILWLAPGRAPRPAVS